MVVQLTSTDSVVSAVTKRQQWPQPLPRTPLAARHVRRVSIQRCGPGAMGGSTSRATARQARGVAAAAAAPATTSSVSDQAAAQGGKKRAFLVFNPVAGQEDPEECLKAIREAVEASLELRVLDTQPDVSAATLAKQALQEGAEMVLASGGDGTINEVAGVLMGTGVPMGIIPRGTANAFASRFRIPTHLNGPSFISDAAKIVVDGHVQPVDAALVTTSTKTDMPMILLAGIGMEAQVVETADREMKDTLGPAAYLVAGAQEVVSTDGFYAHVKFDGNEAEAQLDFITVANAAPSFSVLAHGGEVQENQPDDGRLEVVAHVHAESTLANLTDMARIFIRSLTGIEAPQERVASGRVKQIEVVADPPAKVVVDGELAGCTPLTARVQPGALRVIVPRPGQDAPTVVDKLRETVATIKDKVMTSSEDAGPEAQGPGI